MKKTFLLLLLASSLLLTSCAEDPRNEISSPSTAASTTASPPVASPTDSSEETTAAKALFDVTKLDASALPAKKTSYVSVCSDEVTLIADCHSDGVYLYGVLDEASQESNGVVLRIGDKLTYFKDWYFVNHFVVDTTEILYDDIDSDGEKEIAVILLEKKAIGLYVESLHVADLTPDGEINKVYSLEQAQYESELAQRLSFSIEGNIITVFAEDAERSIELSDADIDYVGEVGGELEFGFMTKLRFENGAIRAGFGIGFYVEKFEAPYFFNNGIQAECEILFDGESFSLGTLGLGEL